MKTWVKSLDFSEKTGPAKGAAKRYYNRGPIWYPLDIPARTCLELKPGAAMAVNREHREQLVHVIDQYLHEELTAFEFDDKIFELRYQTTDETIQHVVDFLWQFYDDCEDHKVVLDRVGWNCWQRLRLLLKSEASLNCTTKRIWSTAQIVAAVALAAFFWLASYAGFGEQLMIVAIPFGIVSIILSKWRSRLYRPYDGDVTLYPFSSVGQLLWVGHSVREFRKEQYPLHVASRRIRSRLGNFGLWLNTYSSWLLYSPIALCAQLLPVSVTVRRVIP